MSGQRVERRLAAILSADVVGYSRLMGEDEVGTLRTLRTYRRELIDPSIAAWHGRIVKTTGDGLLVEFASAVDAVACAIAVQQGATRRNQEIAENKRLMFRVGINIGDVIVEATDIFGDGVNVAARLEGLCEPGGICISRAVRDQVRDKLPVNFEDRGEQEVKNIARPVRVFGLGPQAIAEAPELTAGGAARYGHQGRLWVGAAAAMVIIGGGVGTWWIARSPSAPATPVESTAPAPQTAVTARASIAVMPFTSLTADTGSDYFADGLTEDIIAALGRFRELSVIARAGAFAYKGKNPTPAEVGRDLKVRYVVEGSIRRTPERIRVAVSLTDTMRSALLWSEKYDVEPKDIFSVQDQITRQVSGALAVRVTNLELAAAKAKPPNNLEAHDLILRGRDLLSRLTRAGNAEARTMFARAIELDPKYAPAYVGLGHVNLNSVTQGWTDDPSGSLERAESLARKAIDLDELSPGAHALLGSAEVYFGDYDRALDALKRAIELNPSDAAGYSGLVHVLLWRGDLAGAISAGELLEKFQPNLAVSDAFHLATAYVLAERGTEAVRVLERAIERNSADLPSNVMLAAAYAVAGRQQEAERQAEAVRQRFPIFQGSSRFGSLLRDPKQREALERTLKKAGL